MGTDNIICPHEKKSQKGVLYEKEHDQSFRDYRLSGGNRVLNSKLRPQVWW